MSSPFKDQSINPRFTANNDITGAIDLNSRKVRKYKMINKVVICGINTSDLKVIPTKEQKELLIKVKQGDKAAREKIINGNLKLVLSVVQRFSSRGENPDDLFQVGCIGLIKSIDNFDTNQDVKFSTYAVPMI